MNNFFVVATPIGNISEISKRAIEVLEKSNVIFCEDTRVTKKLLSLLEINYFNKKFIVNNAFSKEQENISLDLLEKNICCLVSDAGYPLISDPGYGIVNFLNSNNINYEIVNGPCSIIHALMVCKFPINNFYFYGFLSSKQNQKNNELHELKKINSTIVLFESSHKIINTLKDIKKIFGDIKVSVCKELTKKNEKVYHGFIDEIINDINTNGEFVIVFNNEIKNEIDNDLLRNELNNLLKSNIDKKTACKMVAYKYDLKPNSLYDLVK